MGKRKYPDVVVGDISHRLTVLEVGLPQQGKRQLIKRWLCRCNCGTKVLVRDSHLKNGNSKSCGCLMKEHVAEASRKRKTHGESHITAEYRTWTMMWNRIQNPKAEQFKLYGGRRIRICKRWESYTNFLADMGRKPSPKHSLDRIDNNGNYEPSNCRWATQQEQMRNTRSNRLVTINNITKTVVEWEELYGFKKDVLRSRLNRGCPPEQLLEVGRATCHPHQ